MSGGKFPPDYCKHQVSSSIKSIRIIDVSSNIKLIRIQFVVQLIEDLPWRNVWSADHSVEVLNEHLLLLVGRNVPTKVIHVRNNDKPWFDDQCRHSFGLKQ